MTHLIKLELKKFGIAQNIIFMFAAILFSILFITISLWDSMTDPKQVKDTFESTYLVIGLLMSFIFLVYSSVLTAKLVIGEYNHRTITIMFSYPLNRIKLIASKLTIIMVYTAISMTIGYICCSSYIIFADKSFNMLEGTFQPSMLDVYKRQDGNIVVDESHPDWWQDKKNPDRHGLRIPVLDENGVQKDVYKRQEEHTE